MVQVLDGDHLQICKLQYCPQAGWCDSCTDSKPTEHIGLVNGVSADHRRRMETEAKAKVGASIWGEGENLFNSLPR